MAEIEITLPTVQWSTVFSEGDDSCWEWGGQIRPDGYGNVWYQGKKYLTHRLSFRLSRGHEAEGVVRHSCDNRACYRPDHLLDGSQKDNLRDMIERDRHNRGERHWNSRLTADQVLSIRSRFSVGDSRRILADEFGVSWATVDAIVKNRIWKDERNFA